jgi:hypothetical protein
MLGAGSRDDDGDQRETSGDQHRRDRRPETGQQGMG